MQKWAVKQRKTTMSILLYYWNSFFLSLPPFLPPSFFLSFLPFLFLVYQFLFRDSQNTIEKNDIYCSLTSLPSNSKNSNFTEILYWVGATTCHTQFLLGGYSLGQPGVVMVPFSLVRSPPQAARRNRNGKGFPLTKSSPF